MVKNIYIDGQIQTLLVLQDESEMHSPNPVYQALQEQAERIDLLEQQNKALINQGEVLLKLLEISTETGNLMAHTLSGDEDEDLPEGDDIAQTAVDTSLSQKEEIQ